MSREITRYGHRSWRCHCGSMDRKVTAAHALLHLHKPSLTVLACLWHLLLAVPAAWIPSLQSSCTQLLVANISQPGAAPIHDGLWTAEHNQSHTDHPQHDLLNAQGLMNLHCANSARGHWIGSCQNLESFQGFKALKNKDKISPPMMKSSLDADISPHQTREKPHCTADAQQIDKPFSDVWVSREMR